MQIKPRTKEKVWVVFMPHAMDDHKTLFQKLFRFCLNSMKKNFSHVAIYKFNRDRSAIIEINCCSNNLFVEEMNIQDFFYFISRPEITSIVAEVEEGKIQAKGFIDCVSLAKHYLGVDRPFIITPYQLYNYLEKKHGKQKGQSGPGTDAGLHRVEQPKAQRA